jgi:hypothetical protein
MDFIPLLLKLSVYLSNKFGNCGVISFGIQIIVFSFFFVLGWMVEIEFGMNPFWF